MSSGGCPASWAGKAVAHVFDDSSDDLRRDVLEFVAAVDAYLTTYTPPTGPDHHPTLYADQVRFWRTHERPAYMSSKHARVTV